MLKVEIYDRSSIYAHGLIDILAKNGLIAKLAKASSIACSPWPADVFLVDPEAVSDRSLTEFVAVASRVAPVLLLVPDDVDTEIIHEYRRAGAQGAVQRRAPSSVMLQAIHAVVVGGQFWSTADGATPAEAQGREAAGPLSRREWQVLRQISRGLTHSQVASALGISRHTVDTYVKRIRSKLGVGNKAELTRVAVLGDASRVS